MRSREATTGNVSTQQISAERYLPETDTIRSKQISRGNYEFVK